MGDQDYWLATTGVEDIENVMEDIEKNGGQEVVQKMSIRQSVIQLSSRIRMDNRGSVSGRS